jgi:predicted dehydrogenase
VKALFIGLGSIGQRHLRNFKNLVPSASIIAYRTSQLNTIINNGDVFLCDSLADYYGFVEYDCLESAIRNKPDFGIICNPSSLHLETALKLAKNGIHIFIEKPLAANNEHLNELIGTIQRNKIIDMIGFQSRFNSCIKDTKSILAGKEFGDIISAEFVWRTYLPDHHPYEDYRNGYAARKDLGGGVVFCLCHELDIIQHFFGVPATVYALRGAPSCLEMEVEDTISALFNYETSESYFPVSLSLSFSQGEEERQFSLLMQHALLKCDLHHGIVKVIEHQSKQVVKLEKAANNRDDLFVLEMKHFIESVTKNRKTAIPISEGKKSLMMALAIHKSLNSGNVINID